MKLANVCINLCCVAVLFMLGFLAGKNVQRCKDGSDAIRDSTTYIDTIPFYYPVPKDSVVMRYIVQKLPVAPDDPSGTEEKADTTVADNASVVPEAKKKTDSDGADSARVILPVTQKVYEDTMYRAYVSGIYPSLDSIFVYQNKIVITERKRPKRLSVGLGVGYGISKHGMNPFLGVSIQYKLLEF